jgi:[acyl-carrier-protein] S-malonyltransferase
MPSLRWVALFSGQGGQRVEHAQRVRDMLPVPARDGDVVRNRVAQPIVVAWQTFAYASVSAQLPPPSLVAGYSVGEIAACFAAGGFDAREAIDIAQTRAGIMDEAVPEPSGLAAILGLDESTVDALCARNGAAIAIRNGPRHFVVGGREPSLRSLIAQSHVEGATRACALPVSVPAHTPLLAAAVPRFAQALHERVRGPLRVPMLSGIDASRLRTAKETVTALSRQLATRLDWAACMEVIAEAQPDAVLEIGPGNALSRMLREAAPDVHVRALDDFHDPAAAIAWVSRRTRA